jgi:hypothetical protein
VTQSVGWQRLRSNDAQLGVTAVEPSGGYLRGDTPLEEVGLLGIVEGWTFDGSPQDYTDHCNSGYDEAMPNMESIVQALKERGICQEVLKVSSTSAMMICVPGVYTRVIPAGLVVAHKRLTAGSAPPSVDAKDTSLASSAAASSSSRSAAAAAALAGALPDLDEMEREDEHKASTDAVWSRGGLAAAERVEASDRTADAGTTRTALVKEGEAVGITEDMKAQAEANRHRVQNKVEAVIRESGRSAPFACIVNFTVVPGNCVVAAREFYSLSSDKVASLRIAAAKKGVSIFPAGLAAFEATKQEKVAKRPSVNPDGSPKRPKMETIKTFVPLEHEIKTPEDYWAILGMPVLAMHSRK